MKEIVIDDTFVIDTYRLLTKYEKHPEDLTPSEKKRLRELGLEVKEE